MIQIMNDTWEQQDCNRSKMWFCTIHLSMKKEKIWIIFSNSKQIILLWTMMRGTICYDLVLWNEAVGLCRFLCIPPWMLQFHENKTCPNGNCKRCLWKVWHLHFISYFATHHDLFDTFISYLDGTAKSIWPDSEWMSFTELDFPITLLHYMILIISAWCAE